MKRKLAIAVIVTILVGLSYVTYSIYDTYQVWAKFYAAANHGDPRAETRVGFFYYKGDPFYRGDGFPQDYAKAMKWWRKAADQGYAEAQFDVGHMYWFGEGVSKDLVQSYMWATLAANQNYEKAVQSIPNLAKSMSPDQIAEGKRRASEWKLTPETKASTPAP